MGAQLGAYLGNGLITTVTIDWQEFTFWGRMGFNLTQSNGAGGTNNREYIICGLKPDDFAPLGYCVRGANQISMQLRTAAGINTNESLLIYVSRYLQAVSEAIEALTGATAGTITLDELTVPGQAGPCLAFGYVSVVNEEEAQFITAMMTNSDRFITPAGSISLPVMLPQGTATILQYGESEQAAQLLPDIDLAINNGTAIYSIMSNTITEP